MRAESDVRGRETVEWYSTVVRRRVCVDYDDYHMLDWDRSWMAVAVTEAGDCGSPRSRLTMRRRLGSVAVALSRRRGCLLVRA
jgi:hypothetical protein